MIERGTIEIQLIIKWVRKLLKELLGSRLGTENGKEPILIASKINVRIFKFKLNKIVCYFKYINKSAKVKNENLNSYLQFLL